MTKILDAPFPRAGFLLAGILTTLVASIFLLVALFPLFLTVTLLLQGNLGSLRYAAILLMGSFLSLIALGLPSLFFLRRGLRYLRAYTSENPCQTYFGTSTGKRGTAKLVCRIVDKAYRLHFRFKEEASDGVYIAPIRRPDSGVVGYLPAVMDGECMIMEVEPMEKPKVVIEKEEVVYVSGGNSHASVKVMNGALVVDATLNGDYDAVRLEINDVPVFETKESGTYRVDIFGSVEERVIIRIPFPDLVVARCDFVNYLLREIAGDDRKFIAKNVVLKGKLVLVRSFLPDRVREFTIQVR